LKSKQIQKFKETEIGKIPEDWNVGKVGDVFELTQGLQISTKLRIPFMKEGYIPLLKIIELPKKKFSEFVNLDDVGKNYISSKSDIIYTRTGQVGLVFTGIEGCVHNNCFKVHYGSFDRSFVYHMLKQKRIYHYANSVAGGSVQKDLTHPAFKSCVIVFPKDKGEQVRIGKFLDSLENPINHLEKRNQILEQIIQSIFKSWFIDFDGHTEFVDSELGEIPKGWEIKTILDIQGEKRNSTAMGPFGSNIKTENYVDFGIPIIRGKNIAHGILNENNFVYLTQKKADELKNSNAHKGDIIIASQGNIGQVGIILENSIFERYVLSQNMMKVSCNNKFISPYFLYLFFKNEKGQRALFANVSSTGVPAIAQPLTYLRSIKLILPEKIIMKNFDKISKSIFEKMNLNLRYIKNLENYRNSLLPKLMSGEIRV